MERERRGVVLFLRIRFIQFKKSMWIFAIRNMLYNLRLSFFQVKIQLMFKIKLSNHGKENPFFVYGHGCIIRSITTHNLWLHFGALPPSYVLASLPLMHYSLQKHDISLQQHAYPVSLKNSSYGVSFLKFIGHSSCKTIETHTYNNKRLWSNKNPIDKLDI